MDENKQATATTEEEEEEEPVVATTAKVEENDVDNTNSGAHSEQEEETPPPPSANDDGTANNNKPAASSPPLEDHGGAEEEKHQHRRSSSSSSSSAKQEHATTTTCNKAHDAETKKSTPSAAAASSSVDQEQKSITMEQVKKANAESGAVPFLRHGRCICNWPDCRNAQAVYHYKSLSDSRELRGTRAISLNLSYGKDNVFDPTKWTHQKTARFREFILSIIPTSRRDILPWSKVMVAKHHWSNAQLTWFQENNAYFSTPIPKSKLVESFSASKLLDFSASIQRGEETLYFLLPKVTEQDIEAEIGDILNTDPDRFKQQPPAPFKPRKNHVAIARRAAAQYAISPSSQYKPSSMQHHHHYQNYRFFGSGGGGAESRSASGRRSWGQEHHQSKSAKQSIAALENRLKTLTASNEDLRQRLHRGGGGSGGNSNKKRKLSSQSTTASTERPHQPAPKRGVNQQLLLHEAFTNSASLGRYNIANGSWYEKHPTVCKTLFGFDSFGDLMDVVQAHFGDVPEVLQERRSQFRGIHLYPEHPTRLEQILIARYQSYTQQPDLAQVAVTFGVKDPRTIQTYLDRWQPRWDDIPPEELETASGYEDEEEDDDEEEEEEREAMEGEQDEDEDDWAPGESASARISSSFDV